MEAETEGTCLQAKTTEGCQQRPEARREAEDRLSLRAFRRNQPCPHHDCGLLVTQCVLLCCGCYRKPLRVGSGSGRGLVSVLCPLDH